MKLEGKSSANRAAAQVAAAVGLFIVVCAVFYRIDSVNNRLDEVDYGYDKLRSDLRLIEAKIDRLKEDGADRFEVGLLGTRTSCLRATLETLISTWPGRARLPEPCGAWPEWPMPGESLKEWGPIK